MQAVTADPAGWRARAACAAVDPDAFFPAAEPGTDAYRQQAAEAQAVCRGCPVRRECLAFALATVQRSGIWGGMTEAERSALLAGRNRRAA